MKRTYLMATAAVALFGFAGEAMALEWNVSTWGKRRAFTEHLEKLAELVSEKTNGDFTMNVSYGGLSNNKENLDGIQIGAFEMAQFCAGYHEDKNPTVTVLELPFIGVQTLEEEVAVSEAVYALPAVKEDMARWNAMILMPSPMPQYNIVGTGEPRRTLADFEGMRVRATGGLGEAFAAVGAVPTSMTASEVYSAMESGVIDTAAFAQHAHLSFRTIDLATWWTENLNPGTVNCPVVANIDAYEALTPEQKQALDESAPEALAYYVQNYEKNVIGEWNRILEEKGVEKVHVSDEEIAAFREAAGGPARAAWTEQMKAQGLPAEELLATVDEALAKARE
ncbi:C4-dicarboxylate ABC transporter substrate-binding protein [Pikeienuella piscinae]|uniref:C4-dicarboxylate ABC transporter substrate-binding protein n=1 Tax=Pikeienuella piscinae TaxID=2748098 RepID=A0A7L5BXT8_9RHOB|nr:C4-dicarboxylate TRAP transporter substrate-binding protein [Pikeienuella piscinae]QIE54704.1 C4-dicarboxylate ABC transporter substrate-binding protein [Pikeienuella piscinae]